MATEEEGKFQFDLLLFNQLTINSMGEEKDTTLPPKILLNKWLDVRIWDKLLSLIKAQASVYMDTHTHQE